MKAIIYFNRPNRIRIIDLPVPKLHNPEHILVRIFQTGICGTDRELIRQRDVLLPIHSKYIILGHEAVGNVAKVGRSVHKLSEGDWVVPTVSRGCGRCKFCRVGYPDLCNSANLRERGVSRINGFMAEYVVEHERNLIKIPNAIINFAVLVEPLSIALKISNVIFAHQPGRMKPNVRSLLGLKCFVLGFGAIGALTSILFKFQEAQVTLVGRRSANSKHANTLKQIDISYLYDRSNGGKLDSKIKDSFDVLVDTTGNLLMVKNVLSKLNTNGIIIFLGIKNSSLFRLNLKDFNELVIKKGLTLSYVHGSNMIYMMKAVNCLTEINRQHPNLFQTMIYQERNTNKFLELILNKKINTIKTVLCFNRYPSHATPDCR